MGIKYRIVNKGETIQRTKKAWSRYKKKTGYELQVWKGKGSGWNRVMKSGV